MTMYCVSVATMLECACLCADGGGMCTSVCGEYDGICITYKCVCVTVHR